MPFVPPTKLGRRIDLIFCEVDVVFMLGRFGESGGETVSAGAVLWNVMMRGDREGARLHCGCPYTFPFVETAARSWNDQ